MDNTRRWHYSLTENHDTISMKTLTVKCVRDFDFSKPKDWKDISEHDIDNINWKEYPYKPQVNFKIAHNGEMLFIHYNVKENYQVRAEGTKDQDPVWQDSCVEFFIEDKIPQYHNFEFNSRGICLSALGINRKNRTPRNSDELQQIIRLASGVVTENKTHKWSLIVGIPFDILKLKSGETYSANFYKCGDKTEVPHYISWNKIETITPDFHCPAFFGKILLE